MTIEMSIELFKKFYNRKHIWRTKKRKKWYRKMLRWFVDVLNLNVSFETIDNFNSGNGGKIIKFSGEERNKNCEFIDNDLEERQREFENT